MEQHVELLKIKAFQLIANYRKPMSFNFWDTYPLPTLSTIRGWFHNVINADRYIPLSTSIQGSFSSVIYDLQTLIKFDRPERAKSKGYPYLKNFNKSLSKSPTYVANIFHNELLIYIYSDKKYLKKFAENILTNSYPSIGRYEDIARIDKIEFIKPQKVNFYDEEHIITYGIYLKKETATKLNLHGINYRMNFKYNQNLLEKTGLRYFEKKDVVYVDNGIIEENELLFDTEENRIIDLIGDDEL